ncbi:transporter [Shewanella colwelliana]|uniref:Transporter n=1 Tax=Shewanella colwelliana TaxID=23 RepID=A0ABQ4P9H7_SHECO|nr:DUF6691 family protein [Shewanella colwelliana]GIU44172.1 transporter [Shewanella colwelliana]
MKKLMALLCGVLFGTGLMLSGLADPAKVISFLNLSLLSSGQWDPSLMLVMSSALAVYLPVYLMVVKPRTLAQQGPVFESHYHLPTKRVIDAPLVIGAALFGLGWGLVGICPGPAIVNLAQFDLSIILFVTAMIVGGFLGRQLMDVMPVTAHNA